MTIRVRSVAGMGFNDGPEIGEAHVLTDEGQFRFSFSVQRGYNQYTGKYGSSFITLWPDSSSFIEIAKAMMKADPNAAIKAFGVALSIGLPVANQATAAA